MGAGEAFRLGACCLDGFLGSGCADLRSVWGVAWRCGVGCSRRWALGLFARFSDGSLSLLACGFSIVFAPGVALRLGSELPLKAVEGVVLRATSDLPPA